MQTIRWLSLCIFNALTKTSIHFCPGAKGISAPYPINCKLTLFGETLDSPVSVTIEGARLRQPDGLRLEEAFSVLQNDSTGIFGLGIELSSPQGRIDLSTSQCIIEIYSSRFTSRFKPKMIGDDPNRSDEDNLSFLGLQDNFNSTNVVVVNGSEEDFFPDFRPVGAVAKQSNQDMVTGLSAKEFNLDLQGARSQEFSWGEMSTLLFGAQVNQLKDIAEYVIYRDTHTNEPVSISAL